VTQTTGRRARTGTFANGMEYVTWGGGPRTALLIPGGPGSFVPEGMMLRMVRSQFRFLVDAGFAVWWVTRRRGLPDGHSVGDMADEYARLVADEFGGRVDLVVGESLGGMIGQHLAARHPDTFGAIVLLSAGCEASPWGKAVDARIASAAARGDRTAAGEAFAEYLLPGPRRRRLRRLLAPLTGRVLVDERIPGGDYLVEAAAEEAFDSRPVLPGIPVPVLLVSGDRDRYFLPEVVDETARLIPRCTSVVYAGKGHLGTGSDKRLARDVLDFVAAPPAG
jgi:pimeloyl-ACP methyl ester carboxylesterase